MATVYSEPIINNNSNGTKFASVNTIGERTTNITTTTENNSNNKINATDIIQSSTLRFVTQDQIDKWNSVYKSIEQNNAINYRWQQSLRITQNIINNGNLIILPNNKVFYDLDSRSMMVFVNGVYINPKYYSIINTNKFYFKNGIIKVNDDVNIIHFNKDNKLNNYDTNQLPLATLWKYVHEFNQNDDFYDEDDIRHINKIQLNDNYLIENIEDKHSILIFCANKYITPDNYNILSSNVIEFDPLITLQLNQNITIVHLSRVLPNENYIGYLWGVSLDVIGNNVNRIKLTDYNIKNHAFSNKHDNSLLIFINGLKINDYTIVNSNTIDFNEFLEENDKVEIIQLGYTADLSKLNDILETDNFRQIFNTDFTRIINEDMRNQNGGFAGIEDDGYINNNKINIQQIYEIIKRFLESEGWGPTHVHYNMPILDALTSDDQNQLCFNDIMVGNSDSAVIELNFTVVITSQHINDRYIELPYDCDTSRAISVKFNGIGQYAGIDYIVVDNEYPIPDRISWDGYGMGSDDGVMRGDTISISYYKKKS